MDYTCNVSVPTVASIVDGYLTIARARRIDAGFSGLVTPISATVNARPMGQVSFADAAFTKAWIPPPRRVAL